MKPFMKDTFLFYKYLSKAKRFLEYGSGGSTYQASLRPNIISITSIESCPIWYHEMLKHINEKVSLHYIDINSKPNTWGHPGTTSKESLILYSEPKYKNEDLILIDGRFRVACAMKLWNKINNNTIILFDDFLNREYYHIVLDYFDIIEKGKSMVVLKKNNNQPPEDIIKQYELIPL